jgi:uncharacterized protein (DUF885 family)
MWTLTAHEARPGHELQFATMVERCLQARAIFAFNSTNVEGWGLYSEWFMLPYLPEEGQLVSWQFELPRAARAFLDTELQAWKMTPQQAMNILQNDVGAFQGLCHGRSGPLYHSDARAGGLPLRRLSAAA